MATTTPANVFPKGIKPFAERKHPKVICMFDVDGTLTPARLQGSKEMLDSLKKLREYTATAFVGGSDFKKIEWQLEILNEKSKPISLHHRRGQSWRLVVDNWDYCFAENGLTAWKLGNELESASFIKYVGEEEYKKMVNFILRYLSEVDVPVKR
jgi:phosphomannomutase